MWPWILFEKKSLKKKKKMLKRGARFRFGACSKTTNSLAVKVCICDDQNLMNHVLPVADRDRYVKVYSRYGF